MYAATAGYSDPNVGPQNSLYKNRLNQLITTPGSFSGTPGFKWALDQGTEAIQRRNSAQGLGNSGNVLAELMKYGVGAAQQDYGNEVDRLGRLSGQDTQLGLQQQQQDQNYDLGRTGNALTAQRNWWDHDLGQQRNSNDANANNNNYNVNWFNANTNRSSARSHDYYAGEADQRAWMPYRAPRYA